MVAPLGGKCNQDLEGDIKTAPCSPQVKAQDTSHLTANGTGTCRLPLWEKQLGSAVSLRCPVDISKFFLFQMEPKWAFRCLNKKRRGTVERSFVMWRECGEAVALMTLYWLFDAAHKAAPLFYRLMNIQ